MALKNIPDPGFAGDDGTADPALAAALAAYADDPSEAPGVLAALAGTRVLVPVVAVPGDDGDPGDAAGPEAAGGAGEGTGGGPRREKNSEMAVPTLTLPGGRRALPAFTSTAALARWDASARPVAVPLPQAVRAAVAEGAGTLLLDVSGPVPYELTGPALLAAAEGRGSADPLDDPAVTGAVTALLAADDGVSAAGLSRQGPPDSPADATLALVLAAGSVPGEVARRVAGALAADETLRARLVRGLDLALLPPGSPAPGEPLPLR